MSTPEQKNEYNRRWLKKNPHKIKEYNEKRKVYKKSWYEKNKERVFKNIENSFERKLLNSSRRNAKVKNVPFNLDLTDIIIPDCCKYLGCKLTRTQGSGKVPTNASLDRIVPSKGYVKGNVQVISLRANRMKQDASEEELITFAKAILQDNDITID